MVFFRHKVEQDFSFLSVIQKEGLEGIAVTTKGLRATFVDQLGAVGEYKFLKPYNAHLGSEPLPYILKEEHWVYILASA